MWIKILKSHGQFKVGDVVNVFAKYAETVIKKSWAEETKAPEKTQIEKPSEKPKKEKPE